MTNILITGAGGFIGSHLAELFKNAGHFVRAVDIVLPKFKHHQEIATEFKLLDLRYRDKVFAAFAGVEFDEVYNLAADMGGMGFIHGNQSRIFTNNMRIDLNMLEIASMQPSIHKFIYTSSGCVYPGHLQDSTDVIPLKESDAFPADCGDGAYSWEKLMAELGCQFYATDHSIDYKILRFHNVYGPHGTWQGGREKAPAALCRKVAMAKYADKDYIEIWGDGEQTRSFMYIDDCTKGIRNISHSDFTGAINLGSDFLVTINELATMISAIAGWPVEFRYVEGPQGVRGRNSDNTLLYEVLGWEPDISLNLGIERTYQWIEQQVRAKFFGHVVANAFPSAIPHDEI